MGHKLTQILVRNLAVMATFWARLRPAAKKTRLINAVKMLLDIAKESSDALVKHYEVCLYRMTLNYTHDYGLGIR